MTRKLLAATAVFALGAALAPTAAAKSRMCSRPTLKGGVGS